MSNPANTPLAFVTVIYRPFPIEASSVVALRLVARGRLPPRAHVAVAPTALRSLFRSMRREPYVAYCFGVMLR